MDRWKTREENTEKAIDRWRDREPIVLAIFPEKRDRSAERESLPISSVSRMSQANNGKQSSSPFALFLLSFPSFHFSWKTIIVSSEGRLALPPRSDIWKANPFTQRCGRQTAMSLLKHWLTTSGGCQHTHARTHTSGSVCETVKIPQCRPTLETIEESRRLQLNGPITTDASRPPLPAIHNELNDLSTALISATQTLSVTLLQNTITAIQEFMRPNVFLSFIHYFSFVRVHTWFCYVSFLWEL